MNDFEIARNELKEILNLYDNVSGSFISRHAKITLEALDRIECESATAKARLKLSSDRLAQLRVILAD